MSMHNLLTIAKALFLLVGLYGTFFIGVHLKNSVKKRKKFTIIVDILLICSMIIFLGWLLRSI